MVDLSERGIRAAQLGILINALLAVTKLLAGVVGDSYALVTDADESGTDIFSSLIVMEALAAAAVIACNGIAILRTALRDLMDAAPGGDVVAEIRTLAQNVPHVLAIEKLHVRRSGMNYHVAIHVQARPSMPLSEAHALGGRVKATIQQALPQVTRVLVQMEPFVESNNVKDG